jgi:hypothetical protein
MSPPLVPLFRTISSLIAQADDIYRSKLSGERQGNVTTPVTLADGLKANVGWSFSIAHSMTELTFCLSVSLSLSFYLLAYLCLSVPLRRIDLAHHSGPGR